LKYISFLLTLFLLIGCTNTEQNSKENFQTETDIQATETPSDKTESPKSTIESEGTKPATAAALSNKTEGWGFRPMAGARPEFTAGQISLMEKSNSIYMGSDEDKSIYLTFDEGYENGYTAPILDTLKKNNVTAAFFITGPYLDKNLDLVRRMVDEGHIVGNHTVKHLSLPSLNDSEIERELIELDRKFYNMFGISMKYLRPPMGEYSERTLFISKNLGYTNVFWSFAYRDWETDNQKGADYAVEQFKKGLHGGGVILLHAVSKDNAEGLERMIENAQAQGYIFKSLDEYK